MARELVLSVAGQRFEVAGVELYSAAEVQEWRSLLATAQQQLGGVSSGLGFWGSPAWVIGGAMVLGFLERAASGAKAKEGIATLERANKLLGQIRRSARMFYISEVHDIELPNPAAWIGKADGTRAVKMNTIALLDRGKFLREHGLTKDDVVNGTVHVPVQVPHVPLGEDFIRMSLANGTNVQIRWSAVDSYRAA